MCKIELYFIVTLQDGDEWGNEDGTAAGELHDQMKAAEPEEIGDMIEPPTKVTIDFITGQLRNLKL